MECAFVRNLKAGNVNEKEKRKYYSFKNVGVL